MFTKSQAPYLHHLLDIDSLSRDIIEHLIARAEYLLKECVAKNTILDSLTGRVITNLFFEPSTRSLHSFEIASRRLNALTITPDISNLSMLKGESLLDTIHTFEAMGTCLFIIRHADNNTAHFIASELHTHSKIINAGDGINQHPSQCLTDLMTIFQYYSDFSKISVAIIGDIIHSRVARSFISGLTTMGTTDIRLIAPPSLIPDETGNVATVTSDFAQGIANADVIMCLRTQKERANQETVPNDDLFFKTFGLTTDRLSLASPSAIIMHPGPLNRGIEIESSVADGKQSVILQQAHNSISMRMAIIELLLLG